jgi:hypothetical protein
MTQQAFERGDWQAVIDAHPLESHDPAEWLRYGVALLQTLTPGAEAGKQQQQAALAFLQAQKEGASAEAVAAAQRQAVLLGLNEALIAAGMQDLNGFNTPSQSKTAVNEPARPTKPPPADRVSQAEHPDEENKNLSVFKPQQIMKITLAKDIAKPSPFPDSRHEFIKSAPVIELGEVIVTRKDSMILSLDKEPIFETSNEILFWQDSSMDMRLSGAELLQEIRSRQQKMRAKAATINTDNLIRISGKKFEMTYLMHSFGWYAYGHLFDTLQRLFPIETPDKGKKRLLVSDSRRVTDFAGHLEMLGYGVNQLISVPPQADGFLLDRLIVPQSPATVTQFTLETMEWIRKCYLENNSYKQFSHRFSKYFHIPSDGFALFLDRSSVGTRNIANIEEVLKILKGQFSQVITFTGRESVHEMLYLFSNARVIIGAHGAMFVNTVFCNPSAKIIEFCPSSRNVSNMVRMCKPSLDHLFVLCEADSTGAIAIDTCILKNLLN